MDTTPVFLIVVFVFGCLVGSFLNVVILRLPLGESLGGRSHCPNCGRQLTAADLVPLVSYVALKGRCRDCGQKISPRYFLIEAATGVLFALVAWHLHPLSSLQWIQFSQIVFLTAIFIAVFVIDLEHYIILDDLIIPATVIILASDLVLDILARQPFLAFHSLTVLALLGAIVGPLPFFLIWWFSRGQWMGFGDVKLMVLLGAAVGLKLVGVTLFLAIVMGGIISVFLLVFSSKTLKSRIPFGTFLTLAAFFTLLYGVQLLHWYLSLIGL